MGGIQAHVGFIEDESNLGPVDKDFLELVKLTYQIPGFGSYGVSCSGHFKKKNKEEFYPEPWGHLGFALIPQMKHIPELLEIINETKKLDKDCHFSINIGKGAPIDFPEYSSEINLRDFSFGKNKKGQYVSLLEIRLGDNGCLDSIEDHECGGSFEIEGNEEGYIKSQERYLEIKSFWKNLENKIRGYNKRYGFSKTDYSKKEFLPFY
jgi:hypothetical protein